MPRAAFIYESALSQHVLRPDHPMRPARLRHTYQLLQAYGVCLFFFISKSSSQDTGAPFSITDLCRVYILHSC